MNSKRISPVTNDCAIVRVRYHCFDIKPINAFHWQQCSCVTILKYELDSFFDQPSERFSFDLQPCQQWISFKASFFFSWTGLLTSRLLKGARARGKKRRMTGGSCVHLSGPWRRGERYGRRHLRWGKGGWRGTCLLNAATCQRGGRRRHSHSAAAGPEF